MNKIEFRKSDYKDVYDEVGKTVGILMRAGYVAKVYDDGFTIGVEFDFGDDLASHYLVWLDECEVDEIARYRDEEEANR